MWTLKIEMASCGLPVPRPCPGTQKAPVCPIKPAGIGCDNMLNCCATSRGKVRLITFPRRQASFLYPGTISPRPTPHCHHWSAKTHLRPPFPKNANAIDVNVTHSLAPVVEVGSCLTGPGQASRPKPALTVEKKSRVVRMVWWQWAR